MFAELSKSNDDRKADTDVWWEFCCNGLAGNAS
jgi:hypothetical protein